MNAAASTGQRRKTIVFHVIAWLFIFCLPYLLSQRNESSRRDADSNYFLILNTLTILLWAGLFYLNAYYLTPVFIYTKKYVLYAVCLLVAFCVIIGIHLVEFVLIIPDHRLSVARSSIFNLPAFFMTIGASITYRLLRDKSRADKLAQEKQEQNFKAEVSFLRSQISPHFIFNVLNNLVALVRMKSDELEPTILKLSSLMQYMLYETDEEKVPVANEVEYLKNYIDLQQQRFGSKVCIHVSLEAPDNGLEIEPMLLIPFVENAFKHGVGQIDQPLIDIRLHFKENILYFYVRNKYNKLSNEVKDKSSGIGIPNVTRRLSLLYPGKHTMLVDADDQYFNISLQLILK